MAWLRRGRRGRGREETRGREEWGGTVPVCGWRGGREGEGGEEIEGERKDLAPW